MPPVANICASGDQLTHSTQFLCPCAQHGMTQYLMPPSSALPQPSCRQNSVAYYTSPECILCPAAVLRQAQWSRLGNTLPRATHQISMHCKPEVPSGGREVLARLSWPTCSEHGTLGVPGRRPKTPVSGAPSRCTGGSACPSQRRSTEGRLFWRTFPVRRGVCVARSQKRTVVSPLPLARWRPSGLNCTASTASVCPGQRTSGNVKGNSFGHAVVLELGLPVPQAQLSTTII